MFLTTYAVISSVTIYAREMNSRSPIEINFWSRADLGWASLHASSIRVYSQKGLRQTESSQWPSQIVPEVGYIALQLKMYIWSIYKWFQLSLVLFLSKINYSIHAVSCLKTIHTNSMFLICIVIHLLISLQFCHLQIDGTLDKRCSVWSISYKTNPFEKITPVDA